MQKPQFVYILMNKDIRHASKTYVGYTVNPPHRLRQHNGNLVGGAKYTTANGRGSWEFLAIISGFPDSTNALQCEWRLKHPAGKKRGKKYMGVVGRLEGLIRSTEDAYWTHQSNKKTSDINFTVHVKKEYEAILLNKLPSNFVIVAHEIPLATISIDHLNKNCLLEFEDNIRHTGIVVDTGRIESDVDVEMEADSLIH
jgi:predicted GIY-YIG superfamily endonuclease